MLPVDENSIEGDGGTVCKEHPGGALRDSITLTFNGCKPDAKFLFIDCLIHNNPTKEV